MIDTHCHLLKEEYETEEHLNEIIEHMGHNIMITSATNLENMKETLKIIHKYENVYGVIGLHPEEVTDNYQETVDFIENHIHDDKVVGIGEIGLDYHYTKDNRDLQIEVFRKQLALAKKHGLTCVVHSRDAAEDTYHILKEVMDGSFSVILHCYGYHVELARKFLKLGCFFGIGGVLTFKNSKKLVEVVKELPLNSLLLETDSPYLSPEPYRGKENEPKNIEYVAKKISEIQEVPIEKVYEITTATAVRQFDLKIQF